MLPAATVQRLCQLGHLPGEVAAHVDGRVPSVTRQPVEVGGPVAEDVLGLGEQVGARGTAMEDGDVVALGQRRLDDVATDEPGPSEHEDLHVCSLGAPQGRSRRVRSSYVSLRTTARAAPSEQNTTGGRREPVELFAIVMQ